MKDKHTISLIKNTLKYLAGEDIGCDRDGNGAAIHRLQAKEKFISHVFVLVSAGTKIKIKNKILFYQSNYF